MNSCTGVSLLRVREASGKSQGKLWMWESEKLALSALLTLFFAKAVDLAVAEDVFLALFLIGDQLYVLP